LGIQIGVPTLAFYCLIPLAVMSLLCALMMRRALQRQIQAEDNASDWMPLADDDRRSSVYQAPALPLIESDGVTDSSL
jgi:hypothetical protein